jgi:acetyl esterase
MQAKLEKKTAHFIAELTAAVGPPIYKLSPKDARKVLDKLQAKPIEKPAVKMEDLVLPCGPHGKVSVRIVRPLQTNGHLPVIMYCHGGGWVLGNKETHDRLIRELACGAQAAVVFINYTPSPEAKFPIPIDEAYEATKYIANHGKELKLDSSRLVIVGDSVGGNMAAAVTLMAKEQKGPKSTTKSFFTP